MGYRKTSGGVNYSDARGQYRDLIGYKISVVNQLNMPVTIRGSTPLGRLSTTNNNGSQSIVTRANVTLMELKPAGVKEQHTRKGKGKKKKHTTYSKSMDTHVVDVVAKKEFQHDNNFYCVYQESVPVDQTVEYKCLTFSLFDFFGIKPSENQYTGADITEDTDALIVKVDVRYIINRLEPVQGTTVETVSNFILGKLPKLDSVFHVDTIFVNDSLRALPQPVMNQFPRSNYPAIAVVKSGNNLRKLVYLNGHNEVAGDVVLSQYQDPDYRMVVLGLEHIRIPHVSSGWRGQPGSIEFAYSRSLAGWYICDIDGNPRGYEDTVFNNDDYKISSGGVYVIYDVIRPAAVEPRLGVVGFKGENMGVTLTWDQWISGAAIILRAITSLLAL